MTPDAPSGPLNLEILERLVAAAGQAVDVDLLCRALGFTSDRLRLDVDALKSAGYVIETVHPHGATALRLLEIPDRLYEHEVRRALRTRWAGSEIMSVESCPSTNDIARDMARRGAPSGALVLAEEQTMGRGRAGRRWHSPPGLGIYASLVFRPRAPLPSPALLQITTGVAVAHAAMRITGKPAGLRWPNDVLFGRRKIAGLLVDAWNTGAPDSTYVVGIGLNVNHQPADFPEELVDEAASLAIAAGHKFARTAVLATLLGSLEEWYDRMEAGDSAAVAKAWRPLSSLLHREVMLYRGERRVTGVVTDLSPVDGVRLAAADGTETWVPAEHVTFIRLMEEVTGE